MLESSSFRLRLISPVLGVRSAYWILNLTTLVCAAAIDMEAPCHRSRGRGLLPMCEPKTGADTFEFAAGFVAGQKGGNLPRSEAHLHKSEADRIFASCPVLRSSPLMLQSSNWQSDLRRRLRRLISCRWRSN
jgi:hypothetical protein